MVGQSMGSYVAQELTFRHPDRASALVVIGGTCITADPGPLGRALLAAATPIARVWPAGYATPVPTQLIVGELDGTGDIRESMAAWAEREGDAEYHVVGGAGHCANLDRPDVVNRLVLAFLERHLLRRRHTTRGE
jgi:3-oxoadipate enol-lactonase